MVWWWEASTCNPSSSEIVIAYSWYPWILIWRSAGKTSIHGTWEAESSGSVSIMLVWGMCGTSRHTRLAGPTSDCDESVFPLLEE